MLRVCFVAPVAVGPLTCDPLSPVYPLLPPIISVKEVRKVRKEKVKTIGVCDALD